jgi:hypothetical protein
MVELENIGVVLYSRATRPIPQRPMTDTIPPACPNSDARYKVIRIEASPTDEFREITSKSCGGPLHGREGDS